MSKHNRHTCLELCATHKCANTYTQHNNNNNNNKPLQRKVVEVVALVAIEADANNQLQSLGQTLHLKQNHHCVKESKCLQQYDVLHLYQ
mmetsp:Transcript_26252/g.51766  ORF Transcript_26252/g.51766 Transcript_26252/m.51766 type:complete len:89 (+) Transcript_26252:554-820(+)